jgi:hypothetical protein
MLSNAQNTFHNEGYAACKKDQLFSKEHNEIKNIYYNLEMELHKFGRLIEKI